MIKIKSERIIVENSLYDGFLYLEDGRIQDISKHDNVACETYDCSGCYVSAGFIDMHTHGGGGHAFLSCSEREISEGCNFHLQHGTTAILPTISAAPFGEMKNAVVAIGKAMKNGKTKPHILGAHLEGPFLSKAQCGAQRPSFITKPQKRDYENLISEFGSVVARWTYAPEADTNGEFCNYLTSHGVLASAGHTDATSTHMKIAAANGCHLVTHLYSCTSTVTREGGFRSLGVIESAFLSDDFYVEVIADGKHLPPELIQMIVKIKGPDKVALVTDSLALTGTDVTEGNMGGTDFIVEDGVCKLKDRSAFAGSIATADHLIRTLVFECGFSVEMAVKMLTKTPASLLGLNKGELRVGKDADIIVFNDKIEVSRVFIAGVCVL